jgi:hypothetical protein
MSLKDLEGIFRILKQATPEGWGSYLIAVNEVIGNGNTTILLKLLGHTDEDIIANMSVFGVGEEDVRATLSTADLRCEKQKFCIYSGDNKGCKDWDVDGDGYKNASFECPTCTDCNDADPLVNPSMPDDTQDGIDNNCNGPDGETADEDGDGIPDIYDVCDQQSFTDTPADAFGCWFTTFNLYLFRWFD